MSLTSGTIRRASSLLMTFGLFNFAFWVKLNYYSPPPMRRGTIILSRKINVVIALSYALSWIICMGFGVLIIKNDLSKAKGTEYIWGFAFLILWAIAFLPMAFVAGHKLYSTFFTKDISNQGIAFRFDESDIEVLSAEYRIAKLNALKSKGLISSEECETRRKQIINSI